MSFTYDPKSFVDKGDFMVVACGLNAATAVACFKDLDSAKEDMAKRNHRAIDLGISTRYEIRNRDEADK